MNLHHGQIIEKVVRRNGYSISELARLANVNRRSVYNWFSQPYLKPSIIHRIGSVLQYDFSEEFPELYKTEQVGGMLAQRMQGYCQPEASRPADQYFWKDKYIELLEKYNNLLMNCVEDRNHSLMTSQPTFRNEAII